MVDEKLLYTQQHEWARIEGKIATIGITDHAQETLGELTFIELPKAGTQAVAGAEIASVESSKAASDVYAPVTGKVTEVNEELTDKPEIINGDPYGQGWICKMEVTDEGSIKRLLSAEDYTKLVEG